MPKFYRQNKKRIDPRYFLNETADRDLDRDDDGDIDIHDTKRGTLVYYATDYLQGAETMDDAVEIYIDGKQMKDGFNQIMRDLDGKEVFDEVDNESFTVSLENFREGSEEDEEDLLRNIVYAKAADFYIETWAHMNNYLAKPKWEDPH